jgi:hypothetical protein
MTRKKIAASLAVVLATYVAAYFLNSAGGGYWPVPDDAELNTQTISEPEDILWQPAHGYSSARWSSALGILYRPLIALDRRWRHKTLREDEGSGLFYESSRPLSDYHPDTREFVRLSRVLYARRAGTVQAATKARDFAAAKKTREELEADPDFVSLRAESDRLAQKSGWSAR